MKANEKLEAHAHIMSMNVFRFNYQPTSEWLSSQELVSCKNPELCSAYSPSIHCPRNSCTISTIVRESLEELRNRFPDSSKRFWRIEVIALDLLKLLGESSVPRDDSLISSLLVAPKILISIILGRVRFTEI